ncbi:MAG TPA: BON domain-containing protein [Steroidobacteraceae bacterium]
MSRPYWPREEDYSPTGPYRGALGYRDWPDHRYRDYPDERYHAWPRAWPDERHTISESGWQQHPWNREGSQEHPGFLRRMFGRGPKGYKRSDERIREEICETLIYTETVDCSDVSIEIENGKALLEGTVPERRMKHMIEDIVASCVGVEDVENRIKVQPSRQLLMD